MAPMMWGNGDVLIVAATAALLGATSTGVAGYGGGGMHMNGRPYTIDPSSALSPEHLERSFRGEFFEIYGPNQTSRYGDVNWHPETTKLPAEIVARFAGKTMAITGYEVDIVRTNPKTGQEEQVLATQQYNHHYSGYMYGSAAVEVPAAKLAAAGVTPVIGAHGSALPQWRVHGEGGVCSMAGTWLNPTNGIKVQVVPAASGAANEYTANCIGPKGWRNATITVTPPNGGGQGSATIAGPATGSGAFSTLSAAADCPPCTLVDWGTGGPWALEPFADRYPVKPSPKPRPPAPPLGPPGIPHVQVFSEGNGNEHRNSYKAYANGVAQLIHSPASFTNNAMIINTNKLLTDDTSPGPIGGPQPRGSLAPADADYQGILECPCTTRKIKVLDGYKLNAGGACPATAVTTAAECLKAAETTGFGTLAPAVSTTSPVGCSASVAADGSWAVAFNGAKSSPTSCGAGAAAGTPLLGATTVGPVDAQVKVDAVKAVATLALACTSNGSWFGLGLNSSAMQGTFALVVDGAGTLTEHQLGMHAAGAVLPASAKVLSSTVAAGRRTVVVQLPLKGPNFDFSGLTEGSLPLIAAVGAGPAFSYHKFRTTGVAVLGRIGDAVCLCRDPTSNAGTIDGGRFNPGVCAPFPTGELLTTHNSICNITEYGGGLFCCHDKTVLLDADQPQPAKTDTWRMKYRFYFEDYADQLNTFRVWWSTEAYNNEYNVPKSPYDCLDPATPAANCTHVIRSQFTGRQLIAGPSACMVSGDPNGCGSTARIESEFGGKYQLTYAAFHCHAPACISGELWNRDTGELICRNTAEYGTGTEPLNETGYVVGIPPCVWGSAAEGLAPPPIITLDMNLTTIKRANSTNGHWGVMALWQSRGAYLSNKL